MNSETDIFKMVDFLILNIYDVFGGRGFNKQFPLVKFYTILRSNSIFANAFMVVLELCPCLL